jgi:hypothetical protein
MIIGRHQEVLSSFLRLLVTESSGKELVYKCYDRRTILPYEEGIDSTSPGFPLQKLHQVTSIPIESRHRDVQTSCAGTFLYHTVFVLLFSPVDDQTEQKHWLGSLGEGRVWGEDLAPLTP